MWCTRFSSNFIRSRELFIQIETLFRFPFFARRRRRDCSFLSIFRKSVQPTPTCNCMRWAHTPYRLGNTAGALEAVPLVLCLNQVAAANRLRTGRRGDNSVQPYWRNSGLLEFCISLSFSFFGARCFYVILCFFTTFVATGPQKWFACKSVAPDKILPRNVGATGGERNVARTGIDISDSAPGWGPSWPWRAHAQRPHGFSAQIAGAINQNSTSVCRRRLLQAN